MLIGFATNAYNDLVKVCSIIYVIGRLWQSTFHLLGYSEWHVNLRFTGLLVQVVTLFIMIISILDHMRSLE